MIAAPDSLTYIPPLSIGFALLPGGSTHLLGVQLEATEASITPPCVVAPQLDEAGVRGQRGAEVHHRPAQVNGRTAPAGRTADLL